MILYSTENDIHVERINEPKAAQIYGVLLIMEEYEEELKKRDNEIEKRDNEIKKCDNEIKKRDIEIKKLERKQLALNNGNYILIIRNRICWHAYIKISFLCFLSMFP